MSQSELERCHERLGDARERIIDVLRKDGLLSELAAQRLQVAIEDMILARVALDGTM